METSLNCMPDTIVHDYCVSDTGTDPGTCQGKFLQLALHGQDYLVLSPGSLHRYHNQILAHFLHDKGVAYHWATDERLEYDTAEAQMRGGGRFRLSRDEKTLELWDDSHVYGRFDDHRLVEAIAHARHPWSGYRVTIR